MLSKDDIRAWLRANFKKGQGRQHEIRELPTLAFCRAVGVSHGNIWDIQRGTDDISDAVQARLSRFIHLWEAGYLEFERAGKGKHYETRTMVRRTTPKPRPLRFQVELTASGPMFHVKHRPNVDPHIPQFKDLFKALIDK